jgi:small-conductance mechanosensitive channel
MKPVQKIFAITLVLLLGATVYGLIRTSEPPKAPASAGKGKQAPLARQVQIQIDQSPVKTAQQLAQLITTPEERQLAQEALRLADYEVDLSFAAALRDATENPPKLSPEAKEAEDRLQKSQRLLEKDQALVAQLTQQLNKATGSPKEALSDQLELAKAEMGLDQDEVDDAKQDLIRAGGDPQDRIQEMEKEHDAATHGAGAVLPNVSAPPEEFGLFRIFQQWSALHQRQLRLWRAKQEAELAAVALTGQHNVLEARIDAAKAESPELAHHSKHSKQAASPTPAPPNRAPEDTVILVVITKQIASDQKALAGFDKRIETEKELADVYARWIEVVAARQRVLVNRGLRGVLIILAIALVAVYFGTLMDKVLSRLRMDRRQIQSLHTVVHVAVRVAALLLVMLVIIGPPGQLGTFLGLAGAGLTVALKDFIVGFIGWFVLMGKNGIRLGDWVEINGVTGEVVEIGPFHTVLLETGNWTDSGHPTGRRVTFTNSFAIEGHYFNFSTSGQWLWDELQLVLPAGQDPYPIVKEIQKRVSEATKESAKQAEEEWRRATRSREMSSFSVEPAISIKPVVGGVELAVRYITRANERYQLRAKLYQDAVDLLGGKKVPA